MNRFFAPACLLFVAVLSLSVFLAVADRPDASKESGTHALQKENAPMCPLINKHDSEWRRILTPEQYRITREKGTEPPFSGKFNHFNEKGVFTCISCGAPLFHSDFKYDSGSGWPSFFDTENADNLELSEDSSLLMVRTEVTCKRCGAHLGHLFDDGPEPSGLRYCINSAALDFNPMDTDPAPPRRSVDPPGKGQD